MFLQRCSLTVPKLPLESSEYHLQEAHQPEPKFLVILLFLRLQRYKETTYKGSRRPSRAVQIPRNAAIESHHIGETGDPAAHGAFVGSDRGFSSDGLSAVSHLLIHGRATVQSFQCSAGWSTRNTCSDIQLAGHVRN